MRYICTTRKDFIVIFKQDFMPQIKAEENRYQPGIDYPLRRETWNNLIDSLVKGLELPAYAMDWACPW
jgi:hypothetical protein